MYSSKCLNCFGFAVCVVKSLCTVLKIKAWDYYPLLKSSMKQSLPYLWVDIVNYTINYIEFMWDWATPANLPCLPSEILGVQTNCISCLLFWLLSFNRDSLNRTLVNYDYLRCLSVTSVLNHVWVFLLCFPVSSVRKQNFHFSFRDVQDRLEFIFCDNIWKTFLVYSVHILC